jgi:hypothetical protein
MSFLTVDHAANIDRIIAILKAGSLIFDGLPATALIRKIFFAETNYDLRDDTTPYIYVQISTDYQYTAEPYGTQLADFDQTQVAYNVVIVTQRKDTEQAQRELFKWTNLVVQQLKAFPRLDNPSAPGTDKKAVRTNIVSIRRLESQQGKEKDGSVISLKCQIGSAWQIKFSDGTIVDLISKPIERKDKSRDFDLFDDASFTITTKDNPGSLSVEYESTPTVDSAINTLTDGNEKTILLLHEGITRTLVGVLISTNKPIPFDNRERTVLTIDTVQ